MGKKKKRNIDQKDRPSTANVQRASRHRADNGPKTSRSLSVVWAGVGVIAVIVSIVLLARPREPSVEETLEKLGALTYAEHIAPIIHERCSGCHRPGQAAPFSLLSHEDVVKHQRVIKKLTSERRMPPWLPDPGEGEFVDDRSLGALELAMLTQWFDNGAPEGDPSETPEPPTFESGWALGEPDLALKMPEPYELPAEGPDVYRNFVIPIRREAPSYVTAFDFNPGSWKAVHHAFVLIDQGTQSRSADAQDVEVGFPGMAESASMPDGHFLSWQPGARPIPVDPDLAWTLPANCDLIIQAHLRPTGKRETIEASVAFYFSDRAPTKRNYKIALTSLAVDIPANEPDHVVTDQYELPIAVSLTAVLPHAHYLGREVTGWATLPSGDEIPLIHISDWDFSWQGQYRYSEPIDAPAGTVLSMEWRFDNTADNPDNPNIPPRRVFYGPQSTDEMAELWFQLIPKNENDLATLESDYAKKSSDRFFEGARRRVDRDPTDARARTDLGFALYERGESEAALRQWLLAAEVDPSDDEPHYYMGVAFRRLNQLERARDSFLKAIALNEQNGRAHGNLGIVLAALGEPASALSHLRRAIEIHPGDQLAAKALAELTRRLRERSSSG